MSSTRRPRRRSPAAPTRAAVLALSWLGESARRHHRGDEIESRRGARGRTGRESCDITIGVAKGGCAGPHYRTWLQRRSAASPAIGQRRLSVIAAEPNPGAPPIADHIGPAPVFGGCLAPTQSKIQTLARLPAATTTCP